MSVMRIKLMKYDAKRSIVHVNMYLDNDHIPEECPPKILAMLKSIDASCNRINVRTTTNTGEWECEYSLRSEYDRAYGVEEVRGRLRGSLRL